MSIKMRPLYFAYGSNLDKDQMEIRCHDSKPIARVKLEDHILRYRKGVATIEGKEGAVVYGAVYEISKSDLESLDVYEGYPTLYDRKTYKLEDIDNDRTLYATGYYMLDHYPYSLPGTGYFNTIRKGFNDWNLPINHFIQQLDTFKQELPNLYPRAIQDSDLKEVSI